MTRSRLLLGIAGVLAGTAVLFLVLGTVFNLILLVVALPFGAAAYFLWSDATGRLQGRIRRRFVDRHAYDAERRPGAATAGPRQGTDRGSDRWPSAAAPSMDRAEAFAALDITPGADQPTIRRAYRDRVKAVHPDAEGGDEDEFRRVRAAYERLQDLDRGKG